ncbi:uncharacterized protein BT62DRAFT_932605 [Guyanagaster necrorhizus]|uniref:Uncharacterized protein n=1 Tax=Guyanagaster necrorhizus TaxID=856835 RepID=A0A9P7VRZ3_9AGAR|nr:uncharacterized protein BT62DRAFT_932605 [Guyanagaster necrorhizus MCA 3950]KAG7445512.1 hypothetical protein BT62DRAFT_932605 [Guyanagaster necrorhizus MCA 3950]
MDSSAVNANVSVDDFDSILLYSPDESVWTTPDPSSSDFDAASSQWWMGTYHATETINASVSLNFTGPAIYIYGDSGPNYGSYEVTIDSNTTTLSAYSSSNASVPYLLYGNGALEYANHSLTLKNVGAKGSDSGGNGFLFDFLRMTVQLAPKGATVTNTTLQETDSSITYTGEWGNNTSTAFSGGGSKYTNGNLASFSLDFHGSAIYVFGDKKNDHREYNVYLDNGTAQTFNGTSGCGGAFGQTCEQQEPCLKFFASNLDGSVHSLRLENLAGVNQSYFDLDSIVLAVPSEYAPRELSDSSASSSASVTSSSSASSTSTSSSNGTVPLVSWNPMLLLFMAFIYLFKTRLH